MCGSATRSRTLRMTCGKELTGHAVAGLDELRHGTVEQRGTRSDSSVAHARLRFRSQIVGCGSPPRSPIASFRTRAD